MTVYDPAGGAALHTWTQNYSCAPDPNNSGKYLISCTAQDNSSYNGDQPVNVVSFDAAQGVSSSPPGLLASGNAGNISGTVKIVGDFATQGALNNGNLTVTGNLTVGGALNSSPTVGGNCMVNGDNNGSGHFTGNLSVNGSNNSSPTVGGNLTYSNACWGSPKVTGTTTKAPVSVNVPAPPSITTIYNTVKGTAGYTMSAPWSVTTIDFTQSPNGIVYLPNDANISTTVTVKGSGTLVVNGNWNQSAAFPPTGSGTINLVVKGSLNCSAALNVTGGVYAVGDWNQSGNFSITGSVTVNGNYNVSGSGTITAAPPTGL